MASWDVIVIGLGGVGSAAALHLAAHGHRVLGIDQYPPVHDRGSSHGRTRIIRQAYFEHPAYVPLLRRAYQLWFELEQATGQHLFHQTGLVELGPTDGVVLPGVIRSAAEHDLPIELLSIDEVSRRWPGLRGHAHWQAVMETQAGYLRVEACVAAHLRCAAGGSELQASLNHLPATLWHGQRVHQWRAVGQGVEVTTDRGVEDAAALVIAGGAWSSQLLRDLAIPLRVLRKHQYWFGNVDPGYHQDAGFPCFFYETPQGYFYGFPTIDDEGVKVARHSGGMVIDAPAAVDSGDEATDPDDPDELAAVQQHVAEFLPGVGDPLCRHAGCYYTVTPDEHFVVDLHPRHPQVTIVAGLSGHGFKFTSVLGEIVGQLATQRSTSLDTSLLRIERLQCLR